MSANNKASVQGVVMRCTLVVGFFLGMLLVACGRAPQPIDGLWGAPIKLRAAVAHDHAAGFEVAPVIIITPKRPMRTPTTKLCSS
ncbi:MAG: hypothetical protein IPM76_23420 [Chloroflexi bacterium]|nr:hypothetical protein [Chloroflexota bacterium]